MHDSHRISETKFAGINASLTYEDCRDNNNLD